MRAVFPEKVEDEESLDCLFSQDAEGLFIPI